MVGARFFSQISGRSLLVGGMLIGALLGATYLGHYTFHHYSLRRVQTISAACKNALEDRLGHATQTFESFFAATKSDWPNLFAHKSPSASFLERVKATISEDIQDIVCIDAAGKVAYSLHAPADFTNLPSITTLREQVAITLMPTIAQAVVLPGSDDPLICIGFPFLHNKAYHGTMVICLKPQPFAAIVKKYDGPHADITVAQAQGERGMVLFSSEALENRQFLLLARPLLKRVFNGEFGASLDLVKNQWLYNARDFLVAPGWGISVVLRGGIVSTIIAVLGYVLWALLALLIVVAIFTLIARAHAVSSWLTRHANPLFFLLLSAGFLTSTWLCCRYVRSYLSQKVDTYKKNVALEQYNMQYATSLLVEHNYHLESVVHTAARDLSRNALQLADWRAYSRKVIPTLSSTNYSGFGISYVSTTSSSAPWKTSYILTNNNVAREGTIQHLSFGEDFKKMVAPGWIRRVQQPEFGTDLYYIYAEPFVSGDRKGFVWATLPYTYIVDIIKVLGKGRTVHALAFDSDGLLLYHPNVELVKNSIAIGAAAPAIKPAVEKAVRGESGIFDIPQQDSIFMYESLPSVIGASASQTRWTIGVMYRKNEFVTTTPGMHRSMVLVVLFGILALICACGLLLHIYTFVMQLWFVFGFIYCGVLVAGIGTFIFLNYRYLSDVSASHAITSKISVIKAQEAREAKLGAQVVPILTKLTVEFLDIVSPNEVNFSAFVSQSIDRKQFPHVTLGFKLVNKSGKVTIKEISKHREGDQETVLYAVQGTIHQINPHYAQAPFDVQRVSIECAPLSQKQPVFLAFDAEAYDQLAPELKPGLSPIFKMDRYVIAKSYFTYHDKSHDLIFALVLQRNLLSVLLESLLPLLVILITIFFITLVSMFAERKRINMLAVISGLFFSIILLHQKYRATLAISEVSFLELFIVVAYGSLAYAYLDVVYLMNKASSRPYKALLFWPAIMTYLLVVTVGIFG